MIDEDLLEYIRENKAKHGIEKLKSGLMAQGVEEKEIEDILFFIDHEERRTDTSMFVSDEVEVLSADEDSISEKKKQSPFDFLNNIKKHTWMDSVNNAFVTVFKLLGVKKSDEAFFMDATRYGAAGFVMVTVLMTLVRYVAGRIIYPSLAESITLTGRIALPEVFILSVQFGSFIFSLITSFVFGGIISFSFFKFLVKYIQFSFLKTTMHKLFATFFIIEFIFELLFNGIMISFASQFLLGYLVVLVGVFASSYVGALYVSAMMEQKHFDRMKTIFFQSM